MRLSRRKPSLFARPWRESRPVALLALIGFNVAGFVAQFFLDAFEPGFVRDYLALSNRGVHDAYAWQFVTAMLLYSSPWHFLGNMLVLYVLGREQEPVALDHHSPALHLIQNCMVYINTLMIQKLLAQPHWQGKLTPRDYAALTPLIWEHVNPYGRFDFDMNTRLALL